MSQKLRWGILSTASIAKSAFIPGVQGSQRGEVAAIASRKLDKAAEAASEYDIPRYYGSYEELLNDPELDAIYIPLPNHLHKEWTIAAAKAGKHALCEKPAALNAEDAQLMIDECKRAGVLFSEGFMYRHHPKHQIVREIIASGEIGQVRAISGSFTFNCAEDSDDVRYQKWMGGGSIYDVGCYPISAARMILGEEPVAATVQAFFSEEHDGVDMMASGLLEFPNQVSLTFDCGMWAYPRCRLEVLGSTGRIELPLAFGWENSEEPPQVIIETSQGRREERVGVVNSFSMQADAFAAAVLEGTPFRYASEDAVSNMRAIDACLQSARTSKRVVIDR